jgi:hypothetical protein
VVKEFEWATAPLRAEENHSRDKCLKKVNYQGMASRRVGSIFETLLGDANRPFHLLQYLDFKSKQKITSLLEGLSYAPGSEMLKIEDEIITAFSLKRNRETAPQKTISGDPEVENFFPKDEIASKAKLGSYNEERRRFLWDILSNTTVDSENLNLIFDQFLSRAENLWDVDHSSVDLLIQHPNVSPDLVEKVFNDHLRFVKYGRVDGSINGTSPFHKTMVLISAYPHSSEEFRIRIYQAAKLLEFPQYKITILGNLAALTDQEEWAEQLVEEIANQSHFVVYDEVASRAVYEILSGSYSKNSTIRNSIQKILGKMDPDPYHRLKVQTYLSLF